MIVLAYFLPALSLTGLILLLVFASRLFSRLDDDQAFGRYLSRIGVTAAVVVVTLVLQRLLVLGVFLVAVVLVVMLFARLARRKPVSVSAPPSPPEPGKPALVDLSPSLRQIRDKRVSLKVKRLSDTAGSIRLVAGYDADSLEAQPADIRKLETIYLPKIERIIRQYLKVVAHDNAYNPRSICDSLDAMNASINQIYRDCLERDKLEIDVEATTIQNALDLDGFSDQL